MKKIFVILSILLSTAVLNSSQAFAACRIEWSGDYSGSMPTQETSRTQQAIHELFNAIYPSVGECSFVERDLSPFDYISAECCSVFNQWPGSGGGGHAYVVCPSGYYYYAWYNGNCYPGWVCESYDGMWDVVCETLINLSSFAAVPKKGKVIVEWATESEIDNAGFNLYRSESETGDYTKINNSLIPAKGSPTQGASYEFIDTDVQNRKTYYYKLEDIDLNGNSTMHGSVLATPRLIYELAQ